MTVRPCPDGFKGLNGATYPAMKREGDTDKVHVVIGQGADLILRTTDYYEITLPKAWFRERWPEVADAELHATLLRLTSEEARALAGRIG